MITVYSRSSCAPCKTLKLWLDRRGIEYQEVSFDDNPGAYPLGYRIFPLTKVNGVIVEGLNLRRISELLAR